VSLSLSLSLSPAAQIVLFLNSDYPSFLREEKRKYLIQEEEEEESERERD